MATFNVKLDQRKLVPGLLWIIKMGIFAVVTHFLILPLIFETFTFFGELRSFWQSILTVVIAAYLSDLVQIKVGGKDWF